MPTLTKPVGVRPRPDRLESLLLANALTVNGNEEQVDQLSEYLRSWVWVCGFALIGTGAALMHYWGTIPLVYGLAEAVIIAGVLAVFVDPLMKQSLLRQASRGIFKHLLGFDQRPEIKEKLQDIVFNTKLFRKSCDLRCSVETQSDHFRFTVEYDSEIINPTHNACDYIPRLEFDSAHEAAVLSMSFTSSDGSCAWNATPPKSSDEPGVDLIKGEQFSIKPESKGVTYRASGKYQIKPKHGFHTFNAGIPTLSMSIRVIALPDDFEAGASPPTSENVNYWQYDRLQMVGDHVTLRWRKKGGKWV